MPSKLPEPTTKWTGRLETRTLDTFELAFGRGEVNKVIRDYLERIAERLREKML